MYVHMHLLLLPIYLQKANSLTAKKARLCVSDHIMKGQGEKTFFIISHLATFLYHHYL